MNLCKMLFIGTPHELREISPGENEPGIHIEKISEECLPVRKVFDNPYVYYVATSRGCGCGFGIKMNTRDRSSFDKISLVQQFLNGFRKLKGTYEAWKRKHEEKVDLLMREQTAYLTQTWKLVNIIRKETQKGGPVELYCIWEGDYHREPGVYKTVETSATDLEENFEIEEREFIIFK